MKKVYYKKKKNTSVKNITTITRLYIFMCQLLITNYQNERLKCTKISKNNNHTQKKNLRLSHLMSAIKIRVGGNFRELGRANETRRINTIEKNKKEKYKISDEKLISFKTISKKKKHKIK